MPLTRLANREQSCKVLIGKILANMKKFCFLQQPSVMIPEKILLLENISVNTV